MFETARLVRSLRSQGVPTRFVLVNQLLPTSFCSLGPQTLSAVQLPEILVQCAALSGARARTQSSYLWQLEEALGNEQMVIVRLPQQEAEIRGVDALLKFGHLMQEPQQNLYGGRQSASNDETSLRELKATLAGTNAEAAAIALDPVAVVMKLLSKPNGITQLCNHPAVRDACQQNAKLNQFFGLLGNQPAGLMMAYMMLTADPTLKPALMELLPRIADLLQ